MIRFVDNFLNTITMYRLVLYYLIALIAVASVFGLFGILPYNFFGIIFSTLFIVGVCLIVNKICAWALRVTTNAESVYITALILALIITPIASMKDTQFFALALVASVGAMASKYIFAINKKHVFNPAAFGVTLTALTIGQTASWWVGTASLLPFVVVGGLLIVRKVRRGDLCVSFFVVALIATSISRLLTDGVVFATLEKIIVDAPFIFFATVMLTEPLTTPPTRALRVAYGSLVGFLFNPAFRIGTFYVTPEVALLVGNIFSYSVSPKEKLILKLKEKSLIARDVYGFTFRTLRRISFKPGHYFEWTLGLKQGDSRGNRRYFTIASSPTEQDIKIGVKFYPKPSAFKQELLGMNVGDTIVASQRAGDFVLPEDITNKLVFIAGGIGITPFRSMIQYLLDMHEKRDIVLLYSNRTAEDIAYKEIFDKAEREIGIKVVYVITDSIIPADLHGHQGFLDKKVIQQEVPDYQDRIFYLSGPRAMVVAFGDVLEEMGVKHSHIKKDFFPGFA